MGGAGNMSDLFQGEITARKDRYAIGGVIILRSLFLSAILFALNYFVDMSTSPWLLAGGAFIGVITGTLFAFSRITVAGGIAVTLGSALFYKEGAKLFCYLASLYGSSFTPAVITLHGTLILLTLGFGAWTTWCFWRYRITTSLEALLVALACVTVLSGHREYRFDLPQIVASLAWFFGVSHLIMLLLLGSGTTLLTILYLYCGHIPVRPYRGRRTRVASRHRGRTSIRDFAAVGGSLLLIFGAMTYELYNYFNENALTRTANGVGQGTDSGVSPLTFHSALGSTNQPAALVRLEGDYKENPYSPMLYLRESALSQFNGHELVNGPKYYDTDVSRAGPGDTYVGKEDTTLLERVPVSQSVFLLADHKEVFALDYPLSIKPLRNPNPSRFKGAYRAYSIAPTAALESLKDAYVGDERWSKDTREYYLTPHTDPRYKALADELTKGIKKPIEKALAIIGYLNKTAIYTLTPNHTVKPDEDPVAPFLFGDKRGYCVHFAHAMVYLLRSQGIPARIATGYLTDLSQAKDGHILLRMSDRHAWAEIFIVGRGWVPFDVQPEQVESHASSEIDMKLLEELMGMIGPGEEVLPDSTVKDEPRVEEEHLRLSPQALGWMFGGFVLLPFTMKLLLWVAYRLPGGRSWRLWTAYVSLSSRLIDAGLARRYGESLLEYRERLRVEKGLTFSLPQLVIQGVYSPQGSDLISEEELSSKLHSDLKMFSTLPWKTRVLSFLNPSSVGSFISGRRW